jgi:hypothetical protein
MAEDFKKEADRILAENMPTFTGEGFIAFHEMFLSLRGAGFSEYQSLWLMGYMLSNGSGQEFKDDNE